MSRRHQRTLQAIFEHPTRPDIRWSDIEALFRTLGAEISEGRGSWVRVALCGVRAVFHRPHPQPVTDRGTVRSVADFPRAAGITER
ncbi:MAG: type II toxin-antitoxin system HicA family toxin [Chloroflexota bacterium]